MRKIAAGILMAAGSLVGQGCGPPAIRSGSEAILYSPDTDTVGVGTGHSKQIQVPAGARVVVLDAAVSEVPGLGKLPADVPPISRISVKEGEHAGLVGYVERESLKPIP